MKKHFPLFGWTPQWTPPELEYVSIIATTELARQLCGGQLIGESQKRPDQYDFDLEMRQPPADYERQALFAWIGEQIMSAVPIATKVELSRDGETHLDFKLLNGVYTLVLAMADPCAPCTPYIHFDESGHNLVSTDGGLTYHVDDSLDPRFNQSIPVNAIQTDSCIAVGNVVDALLAYKQAAVDALADGQTFIRICAVLISVVAIFVTEGTALPLVVGFVGLAFALTSAELDALITEADLREYACELKCFMEAHGAPYHIDTADYDDLIAWLDADPYGDETKDLFFKSFTMLAGVAGINNASATHPTNEYNCEACDPCAQTEFCPILWDFMPGVSTLVLSNTIEDTGDVTVPTVVSGANPTFDVVWDGGVTVTGVAFVDTFDGGTAQGTWFVDFYDLDDVLIHRTVLYDGFTTAYDHFSEHTNETVVNVSHIRFGVEGWTILEGGGDLTFNDASICWTE